MTLEPDLSRLVEKNYALCETLQQKADSYEILPEFNVSLNSSKLLNKLIYGDNLYVLLALMREKPSIQLIYIDPPFASNSNYNLKLKIDKKNTKIRVPVYSDIWRNGLQSYLSMLFPRLFFMRQLLRDEGAIFVHVDTKASHYVKVLMDSIFGSKNFVNEIIYRKDAGQRVSGYFPRKHDVILFYARNIEKLKFNAHAPALRSEYNEIAVKMHFKPDENGRLMREYPNGKRFYKDLGKLTDDIWDDISTQQATSPIMSETTGFETQKPEALLKRIISATSDSRESYREKQALGDFLKHKSQQDSTFASLSKRNQEVFLHNWTNEFLLDSKNAWLDKIDDVNLPEPDIVADFFAGSGTTGITAAQMSRSFILCEVDRTAWFLSLKRVLQSKDINLSCLSAKVSANAQNSGALSDKTSENVEILENPPTLTKENIKKLCKSQHLIVVLPANRCNTEHQKRNTETCHIVSPIHLNFVKMQDTKCLKLEIPAFVDEQLNKIKQTVLVKHEGDFIFDYCMVQTDVSSETFKASHIFALNKISDTIYQLPETLKTLNLDKTTFCIFDIFGNIYMAHLAES